MTNPPRPKQHDTYVTSGRLEVAPFLPAHARSVLDVGCGSGGFGQTLRTKLGSTARIFGVEAVSSQASRARAQGTYDQVIDGYFPEALMAVEETFDIVTLNDVLEHMIDPWGALQILPRWLSDRGSVVAVVPNVQYAPVIARLICGRWDYSSSGILDRTHLRFFTKATMIEMFETSGFRVDVCQGVNFIGSEQQSERPRLPRKAARLARPLLGDSKFAQFVVVARPLRVAA